MHQQNNQNLWSWPNGYERKTNFMKIVLYHLLMSKEAKDRGNNFAFLSCIFFKLEVTKINTYWFRSASHHILDDTYIDIHFDGI